MRYTVTADKPVNAEIYYRDTDPPTFSDYSHDPYVFSPNAEATVGPGKPWVLEATLTDPIQWGMVTRSGPGRTAHGDGRLQLHHGDQRCRREAEQRAQGRAVLASELVRRYSFFM